MRILINASNLKKGGGLQVCDSICRELYKYNHEFYVVLSSSMNDTCEAIKGYSNITVWIYDLPNRLKTILLGRDSFLDGLVEERNIDAVLTIFGPSVWCPRCSHLCGFARAQLIIPESPYYTRMNKKTLYKNRLAYIIKEWAFKRCSKVFYTENPYSTDRLEKKWAGKKVYTVTNYYNQVFDQPEKWKDKVLSLFDGKTFLTISAAYPHKNLSIAVDVAKVLKGRHPEFKFRFVFTIERNQYDANIDGVEDCFEFIGSVDIAECPSLYQQCDIVFQPTLLECFTATYPEAMRMNKPIVTTDMEFAKGLCGEAAEYYSAVNPLACAEAIYKVATDKGYVSKLVESGQRQLKAFDNYCERAEKLVKILEEIADKNIYT